MGGFAPIDAADCQTQARALGDPFSGSVIARVVDITTRPQGCYGNAAGSLWFNKASSGIGTTDPRQVLCKIPATTTTTTTRTTTMTTTTSTPRKEESEES